MVIPRGGALRRKGRDVASQAVGVLTELRDDLLQAHFVSGGHALNDVVRRGLAAVVQRLDPRLELPPFLHQDADGVDRARSPASRLASAVVLLHAGSPATKIPSGDASSITPATVSGRVGKPRARPPACTPRARATSCRRTACYAPSTGSSTRQRSTPPPDRQQ